MRPKIKSLLPPILTYSMKNVLNYARFKKYENITKKNTDLKNIHKGKRCFILGSGPSIKKENLEPLKDEIVFALNNFYVHDQFSDIMSGSCEKYYMVAPIHPPQTEDEWKNWFLDMEKNIGSNIKMIFGLNNYEFNIKYITDKYGLFKKHVSFWYYAGKTLEKERMNSSGIDISSSVYSSETVSLYALMVAIYMGFDEIYLLGMDHNYVLYDDVADMRMYARAIHQEKEKNRTTVDYINEFKSLYEIFYKYNMLDQLSDAKIYNASSGGILKLFPRVKFTNLFKDERTV